MDSGFGPNDPVGKVVKINLDVDNTPAVLELRRDQTSLLCDLRAAGVKPFCPAASLEKDTMPLGVVAADFTVDQRGLSITETVNSAGLPTLLADATLASSGSSCTDATGAALECSSSHPSLSLRLNPEVPGPLAVGALPAMLHASRRLRRRVRGAAG